MGYQGQIPDKRYFKIGEVSKLARVAPHVIRYWESEFDQITPKRARSNQRLYRREDVELILTIKSLLHTRGFTIAGARKLLKSSPAEAEKEAAEAKPPAADDRLEAIKDELVRLYNRLERKK